MLVEVYGASPESALGRYSPTERIRAKKMRGAGHPERKHVSTSHVERSNLSTRMHIRRFTRVIKAFSQKLENHYHALAVYFTFYNFIRIHKRLAFRLQWQRGCYESSLEIGKFIAPHGRDRNAKEARSLSQSQCACIIASDSR